MDFRVDDNGVIKFQNRFYVPNMPGLRKMILEESHMNSLSIHPRSTMMYQDLKKLSWYP